MHHQRMWTSSLAVIPQTLSLPPACERWWKICERSGGGKPFVQGWTHTHGLARPELSVELHCFFLEHGATC